ncbi:small G protein signaling modulator 1-like [Nilaparvata lugens]|uniref:small G protein signaling modulator 1-like n=1 Tax=Nilaparvata lugens TaxID=108931 RepID=UPI00193D1132|nr:small G protein signaling modulator 1-like [Nilaparvata lugens]
MDVNGSDKNGKEKLIRNVIKEVKQIMEEAVTRKFVHEDSSTITSLCGAVEACLSLGLRRRVLGLFKTSSTTALLHKVAKDFEPAAVISKKVQEIENSDPNRRSSSSGDSVNRPSTQGTLTSSVSVTKPPLQKNSSSVGLSVPQPPKYLWIRLALFEKHLAKIIGYLVLNSNKYYDKDALVADPEYGSILSSLLEGPCALDYSKTKTQDHFWTDPPADELVQRHRISSSAITPPSCRRSALNVSLSTECSLCRAHQNKNVCKKSSYYIQCVGTAKDLTEPIPGYLSLHQTSQTLTIMWTPNQLMNGYSEPDGQDKSMYWEYAMNVNVNEIVYVHCHQQGDSGGMIVLVGQDGVQRPPIHFPRGGHLLAFLSCLENGLLPHGQLDPPLWSQRGKGKVLPKLRRRGRGVQAVKQEEPSEDESTDYVFQIISKMKHQDYLTGSGQDLLDPHHNWSTSISGPLPSPRSRTQLVSSSTGSTSSTRSLTNGETDSPPAHQHKLFTGDSLQLLCDSMKHQIISRAFYGWLAYCRHLSTVRKHLSELVNASIVDGAGADDGLTEQVWTELTQTGQLTDSDRVFKLVYYGGVSHHIRKQVWPYLLGHYAFGSEPEERQKVDHTTRQNYETTMSEWLAVEAIVRQRDKEMMAANLAKLSSESTSGDAPPPIVMQDINNDVFVSLGSDEEDLPLVLDEEEDQKNETNVPKCPPNSLEKNSVSDIEINCSPDSVVFNGVMDDIIEGKTEIDQNSQIERVPTPLLTDDDNEGKEDEEISKNQLNPDSERKGSVMTLTVNEDGHLNQANQSACVSPVSSQGGVYSGELLNQFGLNLHRIDKDVQRCDRNYYYFTPDNLEKLRNIMCTYVWEHLDIGYMQGMCDLVAPLLVVFDDEGKTYSCFSKLMDRMGANFPHNGGAMDTHFANMRSLIRILDSEMFELMHQNGDYTHFYFCYRWFLLDFKRELIYDDVFVVWETIWAAKHVASAHFVLFIALALVKTYRDIILTNSMDFTDVIKFFNEMAERHDAKSILSLARNLVLQVQLLIENK